MIIGLKSVKIEPFRKCVMFATLEVRPVYYCTTHQTTHPWNMSLLSAHHPAHPLAHHPAPSNAPYHHLPTILLTTLI